MWLTGRLAPDHKTIADFRKDNGRAIRQVCARFVALCRAMGLLTQASVAIDGSKFEDNYRMPSIVSEKLAGESKCVGGYVPGLASVHSLRDYCCGVLIPHSIAPNRYGRATIGAPPDVLIRRRT
jgi:hypothetical protein